MAMSSGQTPKQPIERVNMALGLVAILALGLGFWQIRTLIHSPFALSPTTPTTSTTSDTVEGVDVQALRNRDTDSDGLSDYDELYLYRTSPYLKDSDSDGIDDKTEATKGTDPNCPQGQTCGPSAFTSTGAVPVNGNTTTGATSTQLSADQIRTLLRNNGVTDAQLAKYDDATLIKFYSEVAGSSTSTPTGSQTPTSITPKLNLTADQKAKLSSMSGAELRQLLRANGIDDASLSQFDDATLQALVKQVINQ